MANWDQIKKQNLSPDWVAQLVRVLSQHAKVAGSIPSQGAYSGISIQPIRLRVSPSNQNCEALTRQCLLDQSNCEALEPSFA